MKTTELNRNEIIAALRQFDEGSKGDILDFVDTEKLYNRLAKVAAENDFTAEDLIIAVTEGF